MAFPSKKDNYTVNNTILTCDDGVTATWDNDIWGIKDINNPNGALRIKCAIDFNAPTLSEYLKTKVEEVNAGESGLIKQEHEATEQTKNNATTDYRYIGANPNNYVCLEADGICEDNELYRIIGIIPTQTTQDGIYDERVKLITNTNYEGDTAKGYYWSGSSGNQSNDWSISTLNTEILNKEYWDKISDYQKYIDSAKWYLGQGNDGYNLTPTFYKNERGNIGGADNTSLTNVITKVGLIYTSDYGYATSGGKTYNREQCFKINMEANNVNGQTPESWWTDCTPNDWLRSNLSDYWFITPSRVNNRAIAFSISGNIYHNSGVVNEPRIIYPTFYLKKDVLYKSGNGSYDNPYRIFLNE